MKQDDIVLGEHYWTNVGDSRVEVVVVHIREKWSFGRDARKIGLEFQVKRADNGVYLPKWRRATALHRGGPGYWPSMTEKQD